MIRILMRTLREIFRAAPLATSLLLVLTIIGAAEPLLDLRIFAHLIDSLHFVTQGDWRPVLTAAAQLAAVRLVGISAMMAANMYLALRVRMTLGITINEQLMERSAATPLIDLETPAFHDRLARAMQARDALFRSVNLLSAVLRSLVTVVAILSLLATLHWGAVLLIVAGSIPAWLIQGRSSAAINAMQRRQVPALRRVSYLVSLLTGRPYAQEVRLFGLSGYIQHLYRDQMQPVVDERIEVATRQSILQVAASVSGTLAYGGSLALLGARALAGAVTVGQFGVMIQGLQQAQSTARAMMHFGGILQQDLPVISDMYAFLDEVPLRLEGSVPERPVSSAPVEVNDLTFRYPGAPAPTLSHIAFRAEPGELIAVVGENGAGKSTLVKLLLGVYTPDAGQVLVDGIDVNSPDGAAIRPRIAAVFQDYLRYALRAGENIGVGDIAAIGDQPRIAAAATASGAAAVVEALPDGYDTPLRREYENGQELSGGQWQKVAIARAYMRQASVLVLDEPTAALDPEAELEVFRHFRTLVRGKTAFFISHRLGAARLADRILVIKHGELVEVGHHDALMARGGEYAALFQAQAHWYR